MQLAYAQVGGRGSLASRTLTSLATSILTDSHNARTTVPRKGNAGT